MRPVFNNVLIVSASAGAGHVRAAQALLQAFDELGVARQVTHIDALEYSTAVFREIYATAHYRMANHAPHVLGWLYDRWDVPGHHDWQRLLFNRLNNQRLIRRLEHTAADLVISTHFLPAEFISWLIERGKVAYRQAIVVTDYDAHAMWMVRDCDQYFVALEETREHLARFGIHREKVTVSGIPIDPVFAQPKSKPVMRTKLGLAPDLPTVLLSASGLGGESIDRAVAALAEMQRPAQILAMCGRDAAMKERIEVLAGAMRAQSSVQIRAVGYTAAMDEYMAAADVLVGKPGGLTVSEGLARGLAFVIVDPIPGQEERNADHLLEKGTAVRCNNIEVLGYKIDCLLGDHAQMDAMRANALRLARPHAAHAIVERLAELHETRTAGHRPGRFARYNVDQRMPAGNA